MSKPVDDPPPGGDGCSHARAPASDAAADPSNGPGPANSVAALVALTGVWEGSSTPFNKIKACVWFIGGGNGSDTYSVVSVWWWAETNHRT
jgi:hypothetical protein